MTDGRLDATAAGNKASATRIYRVSPSWKIIGFILAGISLAGGLAAPVWFLFTRSGQTWPVQAVVIAVGLGFVLLGAYMIADTLTYKVVLTDDAIERFGLFRRRKLLRNQVGGYRLRPEKYLPPTIVLVAATSQSLKLYGTIQRDAALNGWIVSLVDLDAKDAQDTQAEIGADDRLGQTPEERLARLTRAKKLAVALNIAGFGSSLWLFLYPHPYVAAVAVAAALPLVAIGLTAWRPAVFGFKRNELVTALFFPALALTLRAHFDVELLGWRTPLLMVGGSAFVLAGIAALLHAETRQKPWTGLLFLVVTVPYAYGTMALYDTLFDASPPEAFSTSLNDKRVATGKYPSYELSLAPWGRQDEPTKVTVPQAVYDSVKPGDRINVFLQRGALGMPWYFVGSCAATFIPRTATVLGRISDGEVAYRCGRYEGIVRALADLAKGGNAQAQLLVGLAYWEERSPLKAPAEAMRLFRLAAAQGNARAMNVIGFSYQNGIGVPADLDQAVTWYLMAAQRDEPRALNNLALLYNEGKGVEKDPLEARKYLHRSAELGHETAMNNLGKLYAEGDGVSKDMAKAFEWWKAAAARGNTEAQYSLAREYHLGESVPQDDKQAVALLERAADAGFAPAAHMLAELYRDGDGVRKSDSEAYKWFAKAIAVGDATAALDGAALADSRRDFVQSVRLYQAAALTGNARAQALLGLRYLTGLGVAKDEAEALKWYRMAVDQGDIYGVFFIGELYELGFRTIQRDPFEAAAWYLRAAERGLAAAQSRLGLLYVNGDLADRDFATAVKWFRLAAEQEYPEAMNSIGGALDRGAGVDRNPAEAIEWYRRAATYGTPGAMHSLASHHIRGDGVKVDLGEAYYWLLLAERFYTDRDREKRSEVREMRSTLEARLDDELKSTAKDRAREFKPTPAPPLEGARPTSHAAVDR